MPSLLGTIIFSIHQPRFSIFKLFDTLYLVAAGYCVYHGPAQEVLPFFASVGFTCEEHDNPADFILDISQGDRPPTLNGNIMNEANAPIETYLNEAYVKTGIYQSIQQEIAEQTTVERANAKPTPLAKKSIFNEIVYVSQRTLRNAFRNPMLTILQSAVSMFLAVLIGLIYYQMDKYIEVGLGNRRGAIFFIVTNQVFSNLSALDLFIKERVLFVHENVSGYYHVITYFISKILCDILPLRTIPAVGFSLISYFMMGLQMSAEKFFIFLFCIWLSSTCASTLCFFVSASVSNFGKQLIAEFSALAFCCLSPLGVANLCAALFCVLTLIFSGFLVKISSVLGFLEWIQYFSIFRYASNILSINEFRGLTFCMQNHTNICPRTGEDVLTEWEIEHDTNWDLWKNFVALGAMSIGFLALTYLQLRFMKKTK